MYQIGVDIGGTNIKLGLVDEELSLAARTSVPFPHAGADAAADVIRAAADDVLRQVGASDKDVQSVGIILPGSLDAECRTVLDAYNLDFHNVPFRDLIERRFPGMPVYMANDADGAALAELYCGALRGCKTGVLITLGTGLGGGTILNGRLFTGGMHHGSELGHIYLVEGGEACTCGNQGCAEAYCSASALAREGARAMQARPDSLLAEKSGGRVEAVDAKLVVDCARAGDETATNVFSAYLRHLASACASIFNLLDPEVLAIGGGLSGAGDLLFAPLQELVNERCFYHAAHGALVPAQLGNDAGMIGAAMLHRNAQA